MISCFSLTGCDTIIDIYDFDEGCYTSENLWDKSELEKYTQIYCNVKIVNSSDYEKSPDNIFTRNSLLKFYYLFDFRLKKYDMEEFCKVTFSNISSFYGKNNSIHYKGNVEYLDGETVINEEFDIWTVDKRFLFKTKSIDEWILHESFAFELNELKYVDTHYDWFCGSGPYRTAKLSLSETSKKDPLLKIPNQTQGLYAEQWIQIDFYLYNYEIFQFVKTTLFVEGYNGVDYYPEKCLYGTGYIIEDDGDLLEFSFKLYIKKSDDIVIMELSNYDALFYIKFEFEKINQ